MGMAGGRSPRSRAKRKLLRWRLSMGTSDRRPYRAELIGSIGPSLGTSRPASDGSTDADRARQPASCRVSTALARVQTRIAQTGSFRHGSRVPRRVSTVLPRCRTGKKLNWSSLEANRERMKALIMVSPFIRHRAGGLCSTRIAVRTLDMSARARGRSQVPMMMMKMKTTPIPSVHIEMPGTGPV